MTRATRVKGVVVGLLMIGGGVTTVLVAMGIVGRTTASAPCQDAPACEQGCAKGRAVDCREAGLMHLQGIGIERSPDRARDLLRKACDAGDAPGCTGLGALLLEGGATTAAPASEVRTIFGNACDGGIAGGADCLE